MKKTALSVIIPVFNEEDSLAPLYGSLVGVLKACRMTYEVIFVDDGSTDHGFKVLRDLAKRDRHIRLIKLSRNYGQTAAISAGIGRSRGSFIILMDGDGQNDPQDIPPLLKKLG